MTRPSGRWRRGLWSAVGALVALLALWLALVIHPQPLFAHEHVAFADTPLSGPYLRHRQLVAHLLERRGLSAEQLLSEPLDRAWVERDLE